MKINLASIFYKQKPIYAHKIKDFTALYNPYSFKGILIINKQAKKIFDSINGKDSVLTIIKANKNYFQREAVLKIFNKLISYHLISLKPESKLHISYKSFSEINSLSLWINLTNQCNFRCTYCFVKKNNLTFSKEKIDKLFQKLIPLQKKYHYQRIRLLIGGGEPLTKFTLVKYLTEKAALYNKKYALPIKTDIITNGSLITKEHARFFKENYMNVGVSLDGIGESNDQARILPNGRGTFKYTQRGIQILQENGVPFNISATITTNNIYNLNKLVLYCLRHKIPITLRFYEKFNNLTKEDAITDSEKFVKQYKKIITTFYRYYSDHGMYYSPLKHNNLLHPLRILKNPYYDCLGGRNYFSVNPDGTIRNCPASEVILATLDNKDFVKEARKNYLILFKYAMVDNIDECRRCQWRYVCAGGCKLERLQISKNKKAPSIKCGIYKKLIPFVINHEARRIINSNLYLASHNQLINYD